MNSPVQNLIKLILVIVIVFFSIEIFAGTVPPDPGGDPTGGGPPVGGGAPIESGTLILISSGLLYAFYKIRKLILLNEE